MASRVEDIVRRDTRANQPAANTVSPGTLYYVTDESVMERSTGAAWEDVTGGSGGAHASTHQNGGADEISVAGLSGVLADPQDTDTIIESSGPTALVVGSWPDNTYLKRSGSTAVGDTPAGGGGAVSYLGYNTIGGSQEVMTNTRVYLKKITAPSNGFIQEIEAYWKTDGANAASLIGVAVHSDAAGVVDQLVGMNMTPAQSVITEKNLATPVPRWLGTSVCKYVTAGDWWIGFMTSSTGMGSIYYDGSGTDNHYTPASIAAFADPGGTAFALTIGTRIYSIRCTFDPRA